MTIRERMEELEYKILSAKASKSRQAKRKKHIEECPFRTAFQRDRDRILHSKAFRRLKHKTQVYILSGDHYRTRMTHSLEVAQISRTIARGLRLNEDLVEAIALGHDVGHTPFGHSGEAVLEELTGHFRHNEQSLRIVEFLERDGKGLNLTMEVKDGILNHTGAHLPKTLEGRIVRLADRIAYLCHDYDDSLRANLLHKKDLPKEVQRHLSTEHSKMITAFVGDLIYNSEKEQDIVFSKDMQNTMDIFRSFMFERIYHSKKLAKEREQAGFLLRILYNYFYDNFQKLPQEFTKREEHLKRERIVIDYVAGLTDTYAIKLFKDIFLPPMSI